MEAAQQLGARGGRRAVCDANSGERETEWDWYHIEHWECKRPTEEDGHEDCCTMVKAPPYVVRFRVAGIDETS